MDDLEQARELVKAGDYEMLDMLYDSVPGVLSELIRTAFIPRPGYKFIVSDFSAIEARVLSETISSYCVFVIAPPFPINSKYAS